MCAIVEMKCISWQVLTFWGCRDPYSKQSTDQTEEDRVQLKFVRAELNVVVREHRDREEQMQAGSATGWYHYLKTCGKVRVYEAAVTFEELMITLIHWRKPTLVPEIRKLARSSRVRDVIFMCHCLVLKDALQTFRKKRAMEDNGGEGDDTRKNALMGGMFAQEMQSNNVSLVSNKLSK